MANTVLWYKCVLIFRIAAVCWQFRNDRSTLISAAILSGLSAHFRKQPMWKHTHICLRGNLRPTTVYFHSPTSSLSLWFDSKVISTAGKFRLNCRTLWLATCQATIAVFFRGRLLVVALVFPRIFSLARIFFLILSRLCLTTSARDRSRGLSLFNYARPLIRWNISPSHFSSRADIKPPI